MAAAEDVLTNACNKISSLCSQSVRIPTGANLEMKRSCTNNCCKWSCGQPFGVPCTGCSKSRCGESCVELPDTLRIKYSDLTACDALRSATSIDPTQAAAMCGCFSKALKYVSEFADDASRARTTGVSAAGSVVACLVDAGFQPKSNAVEVRDSLRKGGRDVILEAPPVDMAFYASILGAAAGCASTGSTCDVIADLFLRYFQKAAEAVGQGLSDWFRTTLVDRAINAVLEPVRQAEEFAVSFPRQIKMQLRGCRAAARDQLERAADELQEAYGSLGRFVRNAETTMKTVQKTADSVSAVAEALGDSYLEHLQKLLTGGGGMPALSDGLSFLLGSGEVQDGLNAAGEFFGSVDSAFSTLSGVPSALSRAQEAAEQLPSQPGCDSVDLSPLRDLQASALRSVAALEALASVRLDPAALQAGVASYQRWVDVRADLPCVRMSSRDFELGGLKAKSVQYPEFYRCSYSNKVPLPNEHIPYVRLKDLGIPATLPTTPTTAVMASSASSTSTSSTSSSGPTLAPGSSSSTSTWPASSGSTSTPGSSSSYTSLPPGAEANTDRFGSDMDFKVLPTPDPRACYDLCQANSACAAWSYAKPGALGRSAICFLKKAAPKAYSNACCVSGVIVRPYGSDRRGAGSDTGAAGTTTTATATGTPSSSYTSLPPDAEADTDRFGSDIDMKVLEAPDPMLCYNLCQANSRCAAWSYVKPGALGRNPICFLKSPEPKPYRNKCCVSGIAHRE
jgi:hypothetical protein